MFSSSVRLMRKLKLARMISSLFVVITALALVDASVIKLPSLHWHSTNRLFKDQTNSGLNYYLKMSAHIGDSIDLICPRGTGNSSDYEHTIIYKVSSKYEFDNCIINPNNFDTVPILKCDKSQNSGNGAPTKFTVYFVKYSPVPNALEFEEDKEYYFLSTSSGSRDGLAYMSGGVCAKYNMRFAIKIKPSIMSSDLNSGLQAPKSSGNYKQYNTNVLQDNEASSNELLKAKLSTSRPNKFFGSLINSHNHNHNHHQRNNETSSGSGYALSGDETKPQSNQQPQVSNLNLISSAHIHSSSSLYLLLLLVTCLLTN